SIGASSISPSPITTVPRIGTVSNTWRIAVVAAASASSFFPRPIHRDEERAAASVTRANSIVKLLSMLNLSFFSHHSSQEDIQKNGELDDNRLEIARLRILELLNFIISHFFTPNMRAEVRQFFRDVFIASVDMFQTGDFRNAFSH